MRYLVCDLDNTLFNVDHVLDESSPDGFKHKNWEGRAESFTLDRIVPEVAEAIRLFTSTSGIPTRLAVVTSRPERLREATEAQLKYHAIFPTCLIMADDSEHHVGADFKLEAINQLNAQHKVFLILEDVDSIVDKLRGSGYSVWQVKQDVFTGRKVMQSELERL